MLNNAWHLGFVSSFRRISGWVWIFGGWWWQTGLCDDTERADLALNAGLFFDSYYWSIYVEVLLESKAVSWIWCASRTERRSFCPFFFFLLDSRGGQGSCLHVLWKFDDLCKGASLWTQERGEKAAKRQKWFTELQCKSKKSHCN